MDYNKFSTEDLITILHTLEQDYDRTREEIISKHQILDDLSNKYQDIQRLLIDRGVFSEKTEVEYVGE